MRKSPWVLLIFVLIGGLLGGILGEILHVMAPQGNIQSIFSTHFTPGISPPLTIDLVLLKFTIGFSFKVNLLSILGMFIGVYLIMVNDPQILFNDGFYDLVDVRIPRAELKLW